MRTFRETGRGPDHVGEHNQSYEKERLTVDTALQQSLKT